MKLLENTSVLPYNTFGIDVLTRYWFEYQDVEELLTFLQSEFLKDKPFYAIGGGSNLLFTKPYEGVLLYSQIKGFEVIKDDDTAVFVKVGAGVVWDDFVAYSVANNWYGAENLSLIPGSVGATPVQNIGAYGIEAKDVIDTVIGIDTRDNSVKELSNADCSFGYRDSIFKHSMKDAFIVTQVVFKLSKIESFNLDYGNIKEGLVAYDEINLKNVRDAIVSIRQSKLPDYTKIGNAGSFFKNPVVSLSQFESLLQSFPEMPSYKTADASVKIPAGWLIEKAGWKGKAHGNASVYEKQALVIVNNGNASGKEIVELSDLICQAVKSQFCIEISPEVIFL